jgi:hypothetical protein
VEKFTRPPSGRIESAPCLGEQAQFVSAGYRLPPVRHPNLLDDEVSPAILDELQHHEVALRGLLDGSEDG